MELLFDSIKYRNGRDLSYLEIDILSVRKYDFR